VVVFDMKRCTTDLRGVSLTAFEPFRTWGSLRGDTVSGWVYPVGWLPSWWVSQLRVDQPSYVVWSYETPIAWYGDRGWVCPDVKYSVTTGKHQSAVLHQLPHDYECATLVGGRREIR
jgi:hypothetical protein